MIGVLTPEETAMSLVLVGLMLTSTAAPVAAVPIAAAHKAREVLKVLDLKKGLVVADAASRCAQAAPGSRSSARS